MVYEVVAMKDKNLVAESVVLKEPVPVDMTAKRMGSKTVAQMDLKLE